MKKVVSAILIGVFSFAVGLFGLFFAMPSLAPQRVNEAMIYLDSLSRADSLAQLELAEAAPEESQPADTSSLSTTLSDLPIDSLDMALAGVPTESIEPADSLGRLVQRLNQLRAENEILKARLQTAQNSPAAAAVASRIDAATLGGTLTKLEDKELKAILQKLDADVLEQLYVSATSRNQARLLKAMPPDKAATFVQKLMGGGPLAAQTATSDQPEQR